VGCRPCRFVDSDVDDYDAALILFRRLDRGTGSRVAVAVNRHLGSTPLFLAASFLFLLEDLFDNPGIQNGGPPFTFLGRA